MLNACALLSRLLLMVCLTLSGPMAMAGAGTNGAVFSMEICADGGVETLRFDANGAPVAPTTDCRRCLTCCHSPAARLDEFCGLQLSAVLLDVSMDVSARSSLICPKSIARPLPRGPPVQPLSVLTMRGLIVTDHAVYGTKKGSGGRPFLKDANA